MTNEETKDDMIEFEKRLTKIMTKDPKFVEPIKSGNEILWFNFRSYSLLSIKIDEKNHQIILKYTMAKNVPGQTIFNPTDEQIFDALKRIHVLKTLDELTELSETYGGYENI